MTRVYKNLKLATPGRYSQEVILRRPGRDNERLRVERWSVDFTLPIKIEHETDGKVEVFEWAKQFAEDQAYLTSFWDLKSIEDR